MLSLSLCYHLSLHFLRYHSKFSFELAQAVLVVRRWRCGRAAALLIGLRRFRRSPLLLSNNMDVVLMLARMYARRLKGYGAIGYRVVTNGADGPSSQD